MKLFPDTNTIVKKCESQEVGDQYHLFFNCKNIDIVNLRKKYLKDYCSRPNMFKFIELLSCDNEQVIFNVSQFLRRALPLL